ncbi:MAG: 16S rRNA (cytidine(1402)-2'-O)-methyltransferase [Lactobacillus sp.]|jgi:16S rRNA (cytidine1402-2'-O)-methyltransferase|nr:16S rRNA (cytidine(1402)-2'-O)-methyltransferase [Lactobacillus sp.]
MQKQSSFGQNGGKLYLVPTPIGNLEDITIRAKKILQAADYIACEDTRTSGVMLKAIGVHNKLLSFHKYNSEARAPELVKMMQAGAVIAEISDAGMPVISDPGFILVQACIQAQIPVVPLPGPSAFATAVIASGFDAQPMTYYGFLPRKASEQAAFFEKMNSFEGTSIFYEAPHRLRKTIGNMAKAFAPDRQICLARELTKVHEEFLRGSMSEMVAHFQTNEPRGEYVVLVSPAPKQEKAISWDDLVSQIDQLVAAGQSKKDAIKAVAKQAGISKNQLYDRYHEGQA